MCRSRRSRSDVGVVVRRGGELRTKVDLINPEVGLRLFVDGKLKDRRSN